MEKSGALNFPPVETGANIARNQRGEELNVTRPCRAALWLRPS